VWGRGGDWREARAWFQASCWGYVTPCSAGDGSEQGDWTPPVA